MTKKSELQVFLLEQNSVRGVHVRMDEAWSQVLARRDYPAGVRQWLGQALAAVTLMTATLKFDGKLSLQVRGDGDINLLVAQATADGGVRATAEWESEPAVSATLKQAFGERAMLSLIISQAAGEDYQGVVELVGDNFGDALAGYFKQSEQLLTRFWLASDGQRNAGMLLQRLPSEDDDEGWTRAEMLGGTLFSEELMATNGLTLIERLFHEEDVRVHEPRSIGFSCGCSREGCGAMVVGLGAEDARTLLIESGGEIDVDCEFCGSRYSFDSAGLEVLLERGERSE